MNLSRRLATVSYDGAFFHGFAKNRNVKTVQGELERILSSLYPPSESFQGISYSSRTDAGVHGLAQPICFDMPTYFTNQKLEMILSHKLPFPLSMQNIQTVDPEFHLRSVIEKKEYWYAISNSYLGVFYARYFWRIADKIDESKLQQGCQLITGEHDCAPFAKDAQKYESTICNIEKVRVRKISDCFSNEICPETFPIPKEANCTIISFVGNRFLYNQIRRLVGCLIHIVGNPDILIQDVSTYTEFVNRYTNATKLKAPAHGLYLKKVWLQSEEVNREKSRTEKTGP